MCLSSFLQEAIENKSVLRIIYHGGSQPGTCRKIAPLGINENSLRAKCYNSNKIKLFMLDKIEIPNTSDDALPAWDPAYNPAEQYSSINDIYEQHCTQLLAQGWHIDNSDTHIDLYSRFKNGNLRKTPTVSICYQTTYTSTEYDCESNGFVDVVKEYERPYHTCGKSFKLLYKAAGCFLKEAENLIK